MNDIEVVDDKVTLADFLGDEPTEVEAERFVVDTTDKAEWCLSQARTAADTIALYESERDRLIERLKAVCEEKTKDARATLDRMAYLLDPWVLKETARIGKKTIPLVNGEVKLQKGRDSLVVDDEVALKEWLTEHHPKLVVTKTSESVDKNGIKKLLKEIDSIPGCHLHFATEKLVLKPAMIEE